MYPNLVFIEILLSLVIGMWIGVVFKDTAFMKYISKNNWVIGLFLVVIGIVNYIVYSIDLMRNVNLVLVIIGLTIIFTSLLDKVRKK